MSERSKGNNRPTRLNTALLKDRFFSIQIKLLPTGEVFPLKKIHNDMKIFELKNLAEFATGIPVNMQRLYYLDEGDLMDYSDVRSSDIVPGGVLHMTVWNMWRTLVEAVAGSDIEYVFRLGVTENADYKTPTSEYMHPRIKKEWLANRAFIALYIAAHRGHMRLCKKLLDAGANVNGSTSLGHTPLHVAAAQGHGHMVDLLLENGADIDAVDKKGENALAAACRFDHKDCERHLFLFRWQQRAKHMKPQEVRELFAHQFHDSINPVWLKGNVAQVYYTQILPPGEFQGTGLGAPKRRGTSAQSSRNDDDSEDSQSLDSGSSDDDDQSSADSTRIKGRSGDSFPAIQGDKQSLTSTEIRVKKKKNLKKVKGYGRKKSEHPQGYDEWLGRKKALEQIKVDRRKHVEAAQKLAEEDKKRQQEFQDKSYEQWLADKETKKVEPAGPAVPVATKTTSSPKKPVAQQTTSQAVAMANKHLIRSVVKKRHLEMQRRGLMNYDQWLGQSEGQILEQIRAGRTPLQRVIQQISS